MNTDKIIGRLEGGVAQIIFNNPERRNAMSLEMWETVETLLDQYAADASLRVLIVSGAGGKAFVSGADISKFEKERASKESITLYDETTARVYAKMSAMPFPTIARIDGYCVGGGVGLATSCDIRICGESSKFAVPAAKLGLGYAANGIRRLIDLVGPSHAQEIFFTARFFSATEALAMGLVNRMVPDDELESYVVDYADQITANAPLTVSSVKTIVSELLKDPAERDMARCEASVKACFDSQDYIEGRRAFMEKRTPKFTGT
jgi:enoyl-CoA hydratase/carnithine racemase